MRRDRATPMSAPLLPTWAARFDAVRLADPQQRISDAERDAAAERLSQNYSEGRLDRAEFEERLDRALKARTRADLTGLFAGLPDTPSVPAITAARRPVPPRRPLGRALFLLVVIVLAASVGQALVRPNAPWLLLAILVVVWLRHRHQSRR